MEGNVRKQWLLLPKINPPQLNNAVQRERLSQLFDKVRNTPVLWVSGAPGSGKTTTVASYLSYRKIKHAWLRIDSSDNDPATLFKYLALALTRALPRHRLAFPVFQPEFQANLKGFIRLFFRYFAERFSGEISIVVDNAQDTDAELLHKLLIVATEELTHSIQLIIISRENPSAELAWLLASQKIKYINGNELRFTRDEVEQILLPDQHVDPRTIDTIHMLTDGWAAGLVLVREANIMPSKPCTLKDVGRGTIFNYFFNQAFEGKDSRIQRLLTSTAYLPQISVGIAQELSGVFEAEQILEALWQRNLFIERIQNKPTIYQYHSLFRDFLLNHAEAVLLFDERRALQLRSAHLLYHAGNIELAVDLFIECEEWRDAASIIATYAAEMCREGRHLALRKWLLLLPEAVRHANPSLSFWLGESYLASDEESARQHLEIAYQKYADQNDILGQLLTGATVLEAIEFNFFTYRQQKKWITIVKKLYKQCPLAPCKADQLRIAVGFLLACLQSDEIDYSAQDLDETVQALLLENIDINRRISAASILLNYFFSSFKHKSADKLMAIVTPWLKSPHLNVFQKGRWLFSQGYYLTTRLGQHEQAEKLIQEAEQLAISSGLNSLCMMLKSFRAELVLRMGQVEQARNLLDDATSLFDDTTDSSWIHYHYVRSRLAVVQDDSTAAIAHARAALQHCERIDAPPVMREKYYFALLNAHLICGSCAEAITILNQIKNMQLASSPVRSCIFNLMSGYAYLLSGKVNETKTFLATGLASAREVGFTTFFSVTPGIAKMICETALAFGIEAEFVQQVAMQRKLLAPQQEWKTWPWRVKINCLGPFNILADNKSTLIGAKAPQKTLKLLQAIIALGGREVPVAELISMLWRGEGRTGQQKAFDITLHRLRKLLGGDSLVLVKNRCVSLNNNEVWIDAWALESMLKQLEKSGDDSTWEASADYLLSLYNGHLLSATEFAECSFSKRLWQRMQNFLLQLAKFRLSAGNHEAARAACLFGIRREPFANELYMALVQTLTRPEQAKEVLTNCPPSIRDLLTKEATAFVG